VNETPDDKVAAQIIAEITKAKLLSPIQLRGLAKKLAAGGVDEEDWNLLTEGSGKQRGGE
jgi:hypothetical protein